MLHPHTILRKAAGHWRLLREDPERFYLNLLQFSYPDKFRDKLLDMNTAAPLQLQLDADLAPAINVLLPVLSPSVMTGRPNTVFNVANAVAVHGVPVRIVTAQPFTAQDLAWFGQHMAALTGSDNSGSRLTVVAAHDASCRTAIGAREMFMATHWTTAQQVKALLPRMTVKRFFYLIQDFEPGFYAWSSNYALALETYGLDHIGVFNEQFLYDYFVAHHAGIYAKPATPAIVFEPAVDRAHFYSPSHRRSSGKRRLLYYARPGNARNMLGLGLAALRQACAQAEFQHEPWEYWAIGGTHSLPPIDLGGGRVLMPAPWIDYRSYGAMLRESDILLCPMCSPHTSYPVLEMAASGGIAVTNSFGTKTAERLAQISGNIIAAPATTQDLAQALCDAASRVHQGAEASSPVALPRNWQEALTETARRIAASFQENVDRKT